MRRNWFLLMVCLVATMMGFTAHADGTLTYDFTPNTNSDGWPGKNEATETETTYTSKKSPELTLSFCNAFWQKNTSNSYLAVNKNTEGYIVVNPIEKKVITSVTLYLTSGVTVKSKFSLLLNDDTESLGEFSWTATGSNSNTIEIPVERQSGANKLKIKTANTSNQCSFGKMILTYVDATESPKQDLAMSWSAESAEAALGEDFTPPILSVEPSDYKSFISYSSADESVAEVDAATGAVTVKAVGTTEISANFAGDDTYNKLTVSYTLNVVDHREAVTLGWAQSDVQISLGEDFEANVLTVTPEAARSEVKFASTDESVVSVSADGALTVAGAGAAMITASISGSETYKDATASYKVTVVDPNAKEVTFDFSVSGAYGMTEISGNGSAYETQIKSINAGLVTVDFSGNYRLFKPTGAENVELRMQKKASMTVSVPDGYVITEVVFAKSLASDKWAFSSSTGQITTLSWPRVWTPGENAVSEVTFSGSSDVTTLSTIIVKWAVAEAPKPELPATPVFYINGVENADGVAEVAYGSELKVVSANATSLVCSAGDVVEGDTWTVTLTDDAIYEVYGVNEFGESEVAEFLVTIAPLEAPVVTIAGGEVCVERDEPYVIEQGTTISVVCEGATSIEVMELNSEDIIELTAGAYTFTELGEYSLWFTATNPKDKVGMEITVNFTVVERNEPEIHAATFDFTANAYGMTVYSGNAGDYNPDPTTIHNGTVSLTLSGGNSRMWEKSNSKTLRFYKECVFTYSVPVGYKITDVEFVNEKSQQSTDVALQADKSTDNVVVYKSTLTENNSSLSAITVTYEVTDAAERGIVVDGKSSDEVDESFEFMHGVTMIVLTAPKGHTIHYGFEANPVSGSRRAVAPADKDIVWNEAASNPYVLVYDDGVHRNQILHMYTTSKEGEDSELTSLTMPTGDLTGIGEVEADGGEVEYFDLRGVRVARPGQGIYLRRQNGVVSKVAVR